MTQQQKTVELPDGTDFVWYMAPLTIAQRNRAQKLAGSDDAMAFSLQLLQMVAKDENNQPLFGPGDMADLRNALPAKLVDEILLAMLGTDKPEEEDEGRSCGPKTLKEALKKDNELRFKLLLGRKAALERVRQLEEEMTYEELLLWQAHF